MSNESGHAETARSKPPSRWRQWFVIGLWCVAAFVLIYCWTSARIGTGVATVVSAVTIALATLITLSNFVLFGNARPRMRATVAALAVALFALPITCLRVEGFTGGMLPRLVPRWTQRQEAPQLDRLAVDDGEEIDLITTSIDDYPQYLGPDRKLTVPGVEYDINWSESAPELVWKIPVGAGWSAFATTNGFAVTQEQRGPQELVTCYRIADGKLMWSDAINVRHETLLGGVGPRATPTIHEGRVYTLGGTGVLRCLDGADGSLIWSHDLLALGNISDDSDLVPWGRSASPLVVDDKVIIPLGGGSSLISFDKITGEEIWRGGARRIGYSSPVLATVAGERQVLVVLEEHVCGHDLESGRELWAFPWYGRSTAEANNSNPVPVGSQHVFVSKGYSQGSAVVRVECGETGVWTADLEWDNPTRMKTKMTNVLTHNGYIYGLDDSILQCLDAKTGDIMWKRGRYGYGQIMRAGENIIVLTEQGDIVAVEASPEGFNERGRFHAIDGKTWNSPAMFGPYLLVRNAEEAACFKLPGWQRAASK